MSKTKGFEIPKHYKIISEVRVVATEKSTYDQIIKSARDEATLDLQGIYNQLRSGKIYYELVGEPGKAAHSPELIKALANSKDPELVEALQKNKGVVPTHDLVPKQTVRIWGDYATLEELKAEKKEALAKGEEWDYVDKYRKH